jgi:hypothetical protein
MHGGGSVITDLSDMSPMGWAQEVARQEEQSSKQDLLPLLAHSDKIRTVLVTGITGFVGPFLLEAIASCGRWSRIIAIVRPPYSRVRILPAVAKVELLLVAGDLGLPRLGLSVLIKHVYGRI